MIAYNLIQSVFVKLESDIGIKTIRSDQMGNAPKYPYLSYKILNYQEDSDYQSVKVSNENVQNTQNANAIQYNKYKTVVSLTFCGNNYQNLITICQNVLNWFRSIYAIEFAKTKNLTIHLINTNVQDRTLYLEAGYEYRLGFDVRFDGTSEYIDVIEAIEHITVTPKPENVTDTNIVIDQP